MYECDECGLVVMVETPCGGGCDCEPCELVCCGEPMKPAEEKTAAKSKTKTSK